LATGGDGLHALRDQGALPDVRGRDGAPGWRAWCSVSDPKAAAPAGDEPAAIPTLNHRAKSRAASGSGLPELLQNFFAGSGFWKSQKEKRNDDPDSSDRNL